jgi:hypothetical protein
MYLRLINDHQLDADKVMGMSRTMLKIGRVALLD